LSDHRGITLSWKINSSSCSSKGYLVAIACLSEILQQKAIAIGGDIGKKTYSTYFKTTQKIFERIETVVNNVDVYLESNIDSMNFEKLTHTIAVNLTGTICYCTQSAQI
jgi:NADP-dependent 3-hydroxy acid dehydrogenase YdfG